MPRSMTEWQCGREFTVTKPVLTGRRGWLPQSQYRVSPETVRIVYQFKEDGSIVDTIGVTLTNRRDLLACIRWLDQRISEPLRVLIQERPKSKYVRGIVRREVGIVPPADKTPKTSKDWFDFINSLKDKDVVPAKPKAKEGVNFNFKFSEEVTFSRRMVRNDYYIGSINVPMEIVRQGRTAILEFALEQSDSLDRDYGDSEELDGWEDENERYSDEGRNLENSNMDEVIAGLPQDIREEMGEIPAVEIPAAPIHVVPPTTPITAAGTWIPMTTEVVNLDDQIDIITRGPV